MDSANSDAKATSTDAGGVSTLPSVYTSGLPPADTPSTTTPSQSTAMVDWEFLRSIDGVLKIVEIVRCLRVS